MSSAVPCGQATCTASTAGAETPEPVVARYRLAALKRFYFRGDAAFANPEM
jgi:hypothetical protein